jgi:UDP-2,3-diacylglucosamine hydrolase
MIYFLSDSHLGTPDYAASRSREALLVEWLEFVKKDATEIFLVGDLFDMWYEYRTVVPKGYVRLLGKLAELSDAGIRIYAFLGNHDMWMFGYFEQELNIPVYPAPIEREWNGKRFLIGHGDGLGPGDKKYKMIKKVFRNPICQTLFGWLHPDIGLAFASYWSRSSRKANGHNDAIFLGEKNEWLYQYAAKKLETTHYDFFIFGHRHLPLDLTLPNGNSRYLNIGDWISYFSYIRFDGENCELLYYKNTK